MDDLMDLQMVANAPSGGHRHTGVCAPTRSIAMLHTKERCPSCGLWKPKRELECTHCVAQPNRLSAATAQGASTAANLTPICIGVPGAAIVLAKDIWPRASSASLGACLHDKERCSSCGLWKAKIRRCGHCIRRPNRAQALRAQVEHSKHADAQYHCEASRLRAVLVGSPQRPTSAPAYEAISSDLAHQRSSTLATSVVCERQRVRQRARGPGSYRESRLYRLPAGPASGLVWRHLGNARPGFGTLVVHDKLEARLRESGIASGVHLAVHVDASVETTGAAGRTIHISEQEWAECEVSGLRMDHFVKVDTAYFGPAMHRHGQRTAAIPAQARVHVASNFSDAK